MSVIDLMIFQLDNDLAESYRFVEFLYFNSILAIYKWKFILLLSFYDSGFIYWLVLVTIIIIKKPIGLNNNHLTSLLTTNNPMQGDQLLQ